MARTLPKKDVVLIGMGAVGGIASYVLTEAGLEVVGLEAGPRWSNEDFVQQLDELGGTASMRNHLGAPKFNREIPTWRPDAKSPTSPPIYYGMANGVGGSTLHYAACSWRFLEDDFTNRSSTIEKYGKDSLPAGSQLADWPLKYSDLSPYYDKVEYLVGVAGESGANPFEAPRDKPYPLPPLRPAAFGNHISETMADMGYHPFPQPAQILSEPWQGRGACSYCGFCGTGFGCWNGSKSSTLVTAIADAEKTGKLEVLTGCRVTKILSDDSGRITGVIYRDGDGNELKQPAGFVILGGYLYENVRLLLLSTSSKFPNGLSNNAGQVGKYYISQALAGAGGLFEGQELNIWNGATAQSVCMDDFNGDNFDHTDLGFIRGGSISGGGGGALPIGQSLNIAPGVPYWGSEYKRFLQESANSMSGLSAMVDTLPYEANFLDLDPTKVDDLGMPVIRVTFNVYENEEKMAEFLGKKMAEILEHAGASEAWPGPLSWLPVYPHAYGGTRMGDDPSASVVDRHSISHEAPGLAVMGASTFPSSSAYNPTTTVEAVTWLGAEYIAKNFDSVSS